MVAPGRFLVPGVEASTLPATTQPHGGDSGDSGDNGDGGDAGGDGDDTKK